MPEWLSIADSDAVDLFSARSGRGNGHGRQRGEYIELEDLDEDGSGSGSGVHRKLSLVDRKGILIPFAIAVVIIMVFGYSVGSKPPSWSPASNGTHEFYPTTIVVSLDGMHPHYISKDRTPYLDYLVQRGAVAPYMTPSFPSQTFPNHWTLVTGLYPANHGIVGNNFWDAKLGDFHHSNYETLSPEFWGGEPIWATAARQNRISAVHMWPGSDFEGSKAQFVDAFNQTEALEAKVERIFEWVDLDITERPHLIMSYVPDVDSVGHQHGISGEQLLNTLKKVDDFISEIHTRIKRRHLEEIVNLVIVSDHGMAPVSRGRLLFIDQYIDMDLVERRTAWPNCGLRLKDEALTERVLLNMSNTLPQQAAHVFPSAQLPPDWHFNSAMKYGDRIAPIFVVPQVGWTIATQNELTANATLDGVHGYEPNHPLMRALFLAVGPQVNAGKYEPFDNVNFYSFLCKLLQIKPAKNDGKAKFKQLNSTTSADQSYPGVDFEVDYLQNSTFMYL